MARKLSCVAALLVVAVHVALVECGVKPFPGRSKGPWVQSQRELEHTPVREALIKLENLPKVCMHADNRMLDHISPPACTCVRVCVCHVCVCVRVVPSPTRIAYTSPQQSLALIVGLGTRIVCVCVCVCVYMNKQ